MATPPVAGAHYPARMARRRTVTLNPDVMEEVRGCYGLAGKPIPEPPPPSAEWLARLQRWSRGLVPYPGWPTEEFDFHHIFSPVESRWLRRGLLPREMEDKWIGIMAEGELLIARSWTRYIVSRIRYRLTDDGCVEAVGLVHSTPERREDLDTVSRHVSCILGWWTAGAWERVAARGGWVLIDER